MAVVINNLDIWKKEISFDELLTNWDFLYKVSTRLEDLEDEMFGKIMQKSDDWEVVDIDFFNNYLNSRLWK